MNTSVPRTQKEDRPLEALLDHNVLRVDGYLPSPGDIPVSAAEIRRHRLRPGDLITGVAQANGRLRVDTVNGRPPGPRTDFYQQTSIHPRDRLRLETEPHLLTTRMIDLLMPIGKGQRALIVAPPKAGKTTVLQQVADAIAQNHPECHLMVVLVDERPEEVTDMRRSVKGEVVAATFDRPPQEHAAVADLAVERAKRLAEQGEDVVLLLDSLTRLARAHNLIAPGRGRTLSGGLDASALYPPKRLLGAARALEGGGSLTIVATALVENGSGMDTLIFEELKSTGNAELKLDRRLAESRIFPAIDVSSTGTRHDELLLNPGEMTVIGQMRHALTGQDPAACLARLLTQLRTTPGNTAFLQRVKASLGYA
ncbi:MULTISPECIES: transcription termination factor Rho [Actinoplanes]|uniref:transcription termination factor Rho n=1 Tax=Actinoplanes TaxID=1865 RepID=UPI0005F2FB1C|nr:hypothetical protein Acsp01_45590 [Actinoplanes sp. NBRC 101535]